MYNRYIGNTGKFYRVDDSQLNEIDSSHFPSISPEHKEPQNEVPQKTSFHNYTAPAKFPQSNPISNLKSILGRFIPKGMDMGDLLLILVLLLLYLEKEDEEILIILSVLIFSSFN